MSDPSVFNPEGEPEDVIRIRTVTRGLVGDTARGTYLHDPVFHAAVDAFTANMVAAVDQFLRTRLEALTLAPGLVGVTLPHDPGCESDYISGADGYTPCGCAERALTGRGGGQHPPQP